MGRIEGSAPRGCTGKCARQARILFRLELWRQTVDGKVVRDHVVGKTSSASNRPLPVPPRIPCKTESGRKVVGVRFRRAENESDRRIVRNSIDGLQVFVAGNATIFVAQSKV